MKFTDLKEHLRAAAVGSDAGALLPCYTVYGDDAYLKQSAVRMFAKLVDPDYSSFNFSVIPFADGAEKVVETLNTFPVFDVLRVVAVTDVSDKYPDEAVLAAYLKSPNPSSVLVLVCEEGAEKSLGFKAEKVDCNKLDEKSLASVVGELLAEPPARKMDAAALRELSSRTLGDMSRIACEIQKLKSYSDDVITKDDVAVMTAPEPDFQIYELAEAVSKKEAEKSLTVLDAFFKDGVKPMTILSLLYAQYRKMLHVELQKGVPDAEIAALLGVKPGALYHIRRASANYSQMRLKKCVDYLHELQFSVLTGKRNEASALHEAVLTLLNI